MSLLRHLTPALRATRRLRIAALSTHAHAEELDFLTARQETLSPPPPVDASNSDPPKAPLRAYPSPVNPLSRAKQSHSGASHAVRVQPSYSLYVKATQTNTIITLARPNGNPIQTLTGGKVGFKGGNRAGYEAGYKCAVEIFQTLKKSMDDTGDQQWELYLNGFGHGRDAVHKALMASEGLEVKRQLRRVTDKTPIKIGGTRAKKQKRR